MLAAVISPAFQITAGSNDDDDSGNDRWSRCWICAITPRGRNDNKQKRNVSYQLEEQQQEEGSSAVMVVKAVTTLRPGDALTLTYGALGNLQTAR